MVQNLNQRAESLCTCVGCTYSGSIARCGANLKASPSNTQTLINTKQKNLNGTRTSMAQKH